MLKRKVILNPASGNGKTGRLWSQMKHQLRENIGDFDVFFTRAIRDATVHTYQSLTRDGYEHIIAIGGDGTLNEVINGFFMNDLPVRPGSVVSFIPSGTGSDIIRSLQIPEDYPTAITQLASRITASPRKIDIGKLSFIRLNNQPFTMYFVNIASCGVSGIVVRHINRASFLKRLGGRVAFFLAAAGALAQYNNVKVRMVIDNSIVREQNIRTVAIANGQYFGSGMNIAPYAQPDDGVFDVVIVGDVSRLESLWKLPQLYDGSHRNDPKVEIVRGKTITIEPINQKTLYLDVDGEAPGKAPATFEILPRILPVW